MPTENNGVAFSSPYYPFRKIVSGASTLRGAELIPYKILTYLLDMPDSFGYEPQDDNERPRVRLMKYLYYDGALPLSEALPTPKEKQSLLFDATTPDINTDFQKSLHPKGYRLYPQRVIKESELTAKTLLKCYVSHVADPDEYQTSIGITIEIWTDSNLVSNLKSTAYDRAWNIEQCLREALNGVDIGGVGCLRFTRRHNTYNGSEPLWTDGAFAGRAVNFSALWAEGGGERINAYS